MSALVRYEAAKAALAAAAAVDEVLGVRDRAQALAAYAKIAGDRSLEIAAGELRLRAERRLGEMMTAQRETVGSAKGRRSDLDATGPEVPGIAGFEHLGPSGTQVPVASRPTLAEAGIGKKLADRARTYAAMPAAVFESRLAARAEAIETGRRRITVDLTEDDKAERRALREAELGGRQAALPDKRYGVILADPEWRFEVWSRATGMDRSAENHYPTSPLTDILARGVADIAADDCVLALWATAPMLPQALAVMAAWGFAYRSHQVWDKGVLGTGYWFRNQHELLLIGVKGDVPAPAPGLNPPSILRARRGKHSEKPEDVLEMLERLFPTLPKIELNRRGPARPGWDAWGNEADTGGLAA